MLLKTKDLEALGYSKWMLRAIKLASKHSSDSPFVAGHYAYEEDLRAWLKKHRDFVASQIVRSGLRRTPLGPPACQVRATAVAKSPDTARSTNSLARLVKCHLCRS
jgi:hypothetical protein